VTLRNLKITVLAICGLIVFVAILARAEDQPKQDLTPTKDEATELRLAQYELKDIYRDLTQIQQNFQAKMQEIQGKCDAIAKAHNWPKDVTCSAKTNPDLQKLILDPVTFFVPEKPKPQPAQPEKK